MICLMILFSLVTTSAVSASSDTLDGDQHTNRQPPWPVYLNEFAIHALGGEKTIRDLVEHHGFIFRGQVGSLKDHYVIEAPIHKVSKRSASPELLFHKTLESHEQIEWMEQQVSKRRVKRDIDFKQDTFTEGEQWFLTRGGGLDMNVKGAWKDGYSGKGIVISILDDGIQRDHPDLKDNYDKEASTDINGDGDGKPDDDPYPTNNGDNKHGTRCAGEVSAKANNGVCGVGVAFNSSIGGVRMLDGLVNDRVEATALSLNPDHIDIYSASWGPEDNGGVVDGPGKLARQSFINGCIKGRGGKGSIFVWASGNGGAHKDSCNCDGYTNSIYTLSISSATENGNIPWYLEKCSSTIATTYSSGSSSERAIATVDFTGPGTAGCTTRHTGTSASAPLAAGIIALALEANKDLTWRDVQHLSVRTSNPVPLRSQGDFKTNGVGLSYSHSFGFGLMDATKLAKLAKDWKTVPDQRICEVPSFLTSSTLEERSQTFELVFKGDEGVGKDCGQVKFLEHVQCRVSLEYPGKRGKVAIKLTSPMGTTSDLLYRRVNDRHSKFDNWPFMSVHYWGENPVGTWILSIEIQGSEETGEATLSDWSLVLYGTPDDPHTAKAKQQQQRNGAKKLHEDLGDKIPPEQDGKDISSNKKGPLCDHNTADTYRLPNSTCVPECPADYYQGPHRTCFTCHSSCKTCRGPSESDCLSCHSSSRNLLTEGKCLSECPGGYKANGDNKCRRCSCKECENSCPPCGRGQYIQDGECAASCNEYHYNIAVQNTNQCLPCHSSCASCTGPEASECTKCFENNILSGSTCLSMEHNCDTNQYYDTTKHDCTICEIVGCESVKCEATAFTCSQCQCSQCKSHLHLVGSRCLACCQPDDRDVGGDCCQCNDAGKCEESRRDADDNEIDLEAAPSTVHFWNSKSSLEIGAILGALFALLTFLIIFIILQSRGRSTSSSRKLVLPSAHSNGHINYHPLINGTKWSGQDFNDDSSEDEVICKS